MTTLLCSIHRGNICYSEIHLRPADRVHLFYYDDKTHPKYVAEIRSTLKALPVKLSHIDYRLHKYDAPDVLEIAKAMMSAIDSEPDEKEFLIHWSEGPRSGIVAGILVASLCRERVKGVYVSYGELKKPKMARLPTFDLKLDEEKMGILKAISEGECRGYKISGKFSKLKKTRVYTVIKRLKAEGFVEEDGSLSDMAKVALLCSEKKN